MKTKTHHCESVHKQCG